MCTIKLPRASPGVEMSGLSLKKKVANSSLKGITSFHVYVLLWLLHVAMLCVAHARNDINCRWKLD